MRKTNARLEGILARHVTLKRVALLDKELSSGQWETNKRGEIVGKGHKQAVRKAMTGP